ncbi:RrF2 family transcriptional regulator [Cognatishimia maritima]|uniref:Transcriptional regulator, BadM/Rrf2 family n=1 Tax=Cognatishimia maritima TaxID=870908 RepID=A0A1M5S4K7_9RHOB|nr:Rrf2 family transcriptional regulator [Cognatishimia maritima]SHH33431.1 transcriptional regulator, BadM/Rrf2 family [Cognatishimia maritima]
MRMTKRTNLAMRVLMFCAVNKGRLVTKTEISDICHTSENHLAQVINELGRLGYLATHRGRNGGVELGLPATEISIGEIFRFMEGPDPENDCFADTDGSCPLVEACRLKEALKDAAEAFFARLDDLTLDSLVCKNRALQKILLPDPCLS